MDKKTVPFYDIVSYPINPPIGPNAFGAKPIVASNYQTTKDDPWNKEFWGRTKSEAIAKAQAAIDRWIESQN